MFMNVNAFFKSLLCPRCVLCSLDLLPSVGFHKIIITLYLSHRARNARLLYIQYTIASHRIESGEIIKLILIAPHDSIDRHS